MSGSDDFRSANAAGREGGKRGRGFRMYLLVGLRTLLGNGLGNRHGLHVANQGDGCDCSLQRLTEGMTSGMHSNSAAGVILVNIPMAGPKQAEIIFQECPM